MLGLLALEAERSWTVEELARASGASRPSVHRELDRALNAGIVERDDRRRPHRYRAATSSPVYEPLRELLALTVGVDIQIRELLSAFPGVEAAAIHGSWAAGTTRPTSDVDVLVLGDVDLEQLRRALRGVGARVGRRIDVTAFTPAEFKRRSEVGDAFLAKALSGPHVALVGDLPAMNV
jgi:predicted nucleotidyltransferase